MQHDSTAHLYLVGALAEWASHEPALAAHYASVRRFDDAAVFTDWLDYANMPTHTCVLMPLRHRPLSGLDLLDILRADMVAMPVVLLARSEELIDAVRTTRYDGVYMVWQPFGQARILDAINRALSEWDIARDIVIEPAPCISLKERIATLSMRQRQVLHYVFAGNANRAIADHLGISVKTVELHRASMMKKMQADSVVDLIRMLADYGRALQDA